MTTVPQSNRYCTRDVISDPPTSVLIVRGEHGETLPSASSNNASADLYVVQESDVEPTEGWSTRFGKSQLSICFMHSFGKCSGRCNNDASTCHQIHINREALDALRATYRNRTRALFSRTIKAHLSEEMRLTMSRLARKDLTLKYLEYRAQDIEDTAGLQTYEAAYRSWLQSPPDAPDVFHDTAVFQCSSFATTGRCEAGAACTCIHGDVRSAQVRDHIVANALRQLAAMAPPSTSVVSAAGDAFGVHSSQRRQANSITSPNHGGGTASFPLSVGAMPTHPSMLAMPGALMPMAGGAMMSPTPFPSSFHPHMAAANPHSMVHGASPFAMLAPPQVASSYPGTVGGMPSFMPMQPQMVTGPNGMPYVIAGSALQPTVMTQQQPMYVFVMPPQAAAASAQQSTTDASPSNESPDTTRPDVHSPLPSGGSNTPVALSSPSNSLDMPHGLMTMQPMMAVPQGAAGGAYFITAASGNGQPSASMMPQHITPPFALQTIPIPGSSSPTQTSCYNANPQQPDVNGVLGDERRSPDSMLSMSEPSEIHGQTLWNDELRMSPHSAGTTPRLAGSAVPSVTDAAGIESSSSHATPSKLTSAAAAAPPAAASVATDRMIQMFRSHFSPSSTI